MKNSSLNGNSHSGGCPKDRIFPDSAETNSNISIKAGNTHMTEQLTMPPAHVWDKIEKILDEQENRRKEASKIIASSFKHNKRKLYATVAGLSILAGIIWKAV